MHVALWYIAPPVAAAAWVALHPLLQPGLDVRLGVLAASIVAALGVYFLADRADRLLAGPRFGLYGALVVLSVGYLWLDTAGPLARGQVTVFGLAAGIERLPALAKAVVLVPVGAAAIGALLWLEVALPGLLGKREREKRKRARSDLYGKSRLMSGRERRGLERGQGILLGQTGASRRARLVAWPLEGSAITLAPPRTGKGATIALNLLNPGKRGPSGSVIVIDPRGETYPIVARRRRAMGRRVVLIDPFGMVAGHAATFPKHGFPAVRSDCYNPLDFIRPTEGEAVRDIGVLLDALLTPPAHSHGSAEHFHAAARDIIAGYIAWVRFMEPPRYRNLETVRHLALQTADERKQWLTTVGRSSSKIVCRDLFQTAINRQTQVSGEEAGSQFSTVSTQLAFLTFPEVAEQCRHSTFDPVDLGRGDMDLFVVVPDDMIDAVRSWVRLWIAIPNAVPNRRALDRDLLLVIDEMPRLGYLKPVMDAYNLAAGKGVHFWCFAQSISSLDSTWGRDHRKTLLDLAEVVQVLGFPRTDATGADELSKAIGTATFEAQSESRSGSVAGDRVLGGGGRSQGRGDVVAGARAHCHAGSADDVGCGRAICDRRQQDGGP